MNNSVKGKVKVILEKQEFSEKFSKQDLVIETDSKFNPLVCITFANDQIEWLEGLKIGEDVEVHLFIGGREWTNPKTNEVKYFNSLTGWKIDIMNGQENNVKPEPTKSQSEEEDDDLPF